MGALVLAFPLNSIPSLTIGAPAKANTQTWVEECVFANYYARAVSGFGNGDVGTAEVYKTPPNGGWSAPSPNGFSDEAAWLVHEASATSAPSNAIEGGYYTGAGSGVPFTTGLVPYYTLNDGSPEVDDKGVFLSANTTYTTYVVDGGSVNVGGHLMTFNYAVSEDGLNFVQGETDTTAAWMMNGGSGETYTGYWSSDGAHWYLWGFNTDCKNDPYFATNVNSSSYKNGGY